MTRYEEKVLSSLIYANTIYEGKYYKMKLKIIDCIEITKEEYYGTKKEIKDKKPINLKEL